jgi:epoxyqueuosine reductase
MNWMAETATRRSHPHRLWPAAQSAVVVAANYAPAFDPLALLERRERGIVSVYAARRDYHEVVKGRLKTLASKLSSWTGAKYKVFVDTAPLMEKPLAAAAGLGWQGKHTALLSRRLGNWLFIGVILTAAELPADSAESDRCGLCRRCLDICPTDAFPAPYVLDSRRCIAYLTVEHPGPIDREFRPLMGNRIFGCDDCLAVCPWNKFASESRDARLMLRRDLIDAPLGELAGLDDAGFRRRFAGTPVKRTGRDRFVRNVLIAVGNSGDAALAGLAEARLGDAAGVVRGAAVWALAQLLPPARLRALADRYLPEEADDEVRREWQAALVDRSGGQP